MITNEKQLRSTRSIIDRFKKALLELAPDAGSPSGSELGEMQREALSSQIEELEEDVRLYERLRSGRLTEFTAENLGELPTILIQARIARGLSQKDLANYLGLKEQQIQRYEAERYRSASLDRLIEVSDALGVQIRKRAELVGDKSLTSVDPAVWRSFPIAEMYKRGWFEDFAGSLAEARKSAAELVPAFLRSSQSGYAAPAFHRKSVRASGQVHEPAIAAWEARVRQLADRMPTNVMFDRSRINDAWLAGLISLSLHDEGPTKAAQYLREAGITLIIEPHLPSTLLDGAALYSADNKAVIALTLRHDRLDNFWFTLLHEVAHLKFHVGEGEFAAIFDDNDAPAESLVEVEADAFAQETLLPSEKWTLAASRYTRTEKAVMIDAKRFGVAPAIIAGRIRREAGDYTLLRNLVGYGSVRRQLAA